MVWRVVVLRGWRHPHCWPHRAVAPPHPNIAHRLLPHCPSAPPPRDSSKLFHQSAIHQNCFEETISWCEGFHDGDYFMVLKSLIPLIQTPPPRHQSRPYRPLPSAINPLGPINTPWSALPTSRFEPLPPFSLRNPTPFPPHWLSLSLSLSLSSVTPPPMLASLSPSWLLPKPNCFGVNCSLFF